MESVFYKYGYKKRFPVTYLFLELFSKSVENSDADNEDITDILLPVLTALGKKPPYSEEFLTHILQDMDEYRRSKEGKDTSPAPKGKRQFGTEFIKWFAKLETDQILILITDFDFDKAYKIYSEVPVMFVDKMIETKLSYEWTKAEKDFEAVVFGMGGSIKGKSSDSGGFSVPKSEEELKQRNAALKQLGFM